ncbi:MAG: MFS transporter [Buchnera aphidicola (Nurudea shiraii)]
MTNKFNFEIKEWKFILGVCTIFSLRAFGMFMIYPVFSIYGINLKNSTILLIGLAMGAYGFFQAIFQIPYGWLSDKIGRKYVIILGLLCFSMGSFICLNSSSIFGIILGRSIQGSGAISSVCMALLSDIVSRKNLTRAMGCLGMSFGLSFLLSVVISPIIVKIFGFHVLFLVSLIFSVICIIVAFYFIPSFKHKNNIFSIKTEYKNFLKILKNPNLCQLNLNNFFLHFILILYFIIIPVQLNIYKCFVHLSWILYLVVIVISFLVVLPITENIKTNTSKKKIAFFLIVLLVISDLLLVLIKNYFFFFIFNLQVFFVVFSFFEMVLPILISEYSPKSYKGTSMALYSINQFLGSSLGGMLGGFVLHYFNSSILFLFRFFMVCIWLFINLWRL